MEADADQKLNNGLTPTSGQQKKLSSGQRKEIVVRLTAIAEAVGESLTAHRIELYLQAIDDLPFEKVKEFLEQGIRNFRWVPKIPDIREAVLGKNSTPQIQEASDADAAWLRVLAYANKWHPDIGPYHDAPKITKGESLALRAAGGIEMLFNLQDSGSTDLAFMQKRFLDAYKRADNIGLSLAQATEQPRKSLPGDEFQNINEIIKHYGEQ